MSKKLDGLFVGLLGIMALAIFGFGLANLAGSLGASFLPGSNELVQEERDLGEFKKISLLGGGKFKIVKVDAGKNTIELRGGKNAVQSTSTEVRGDTLYVSQARALPLFSNFNNVEYDISLTSGSNLEAVEISGNSQFSSDESITSANLTLKILGAGDIILNNVSVGKVQSEISGSGRINLKGKAEELTTTTFGSGDSELSELEAKKVVAKIFGSGDVRVFATETLDAQITGSGDIRYKGDPELVQNVSGSGSIQKE